MTKEKCHKWVNDGGVLKQVCRICKATCLRELDTGKIHEYDAETILSAPEVRPVRKPRL